MTSNRQETSSRLAPIQSLVLLVEPNGTRNEAHRAALADAGFRVVSVGTEAIDIADILHQRPAVVAAELDGPGSVATLNLAKKFRQDARTRPIPFIIYGHHLQPQDIEETARVGALWLQLEPRDGARLVAAVRGLIRASVERSIEARTPRE